jgi:glycolate oxidase iron-sulfur subunit
VLRVGGTYSVTQPTLSKRLRERKLANIEPASPRRSCRRHRLHHAPAGRHRHAVRHWLEWLDAAMSAR